MRKPKLIVTFPHGRLDTNQSIFLELQLIRKSNKSVENHSFHKYIIQETDINLISIFFIGTSNTYDDQHFLTRKAVPTETHKKLLFVVFQNHRLKETN